MVHVFYVRTELDAKQRIFWVIVVGISSAYLLYRPQTKQQQQLLPAPKPQEIVKPLPPKPRKPKSYSDAIKIASEFKKPIIFVFTTNHCHWCDKLKSETLNDPKVKETLDEYVYFEVKFEKNKNVCARYGIGSFPAYRIVEVVDELQEVVVKSGSGFKKPDAFIQWIVLERGVK